MSLDSASVRETFGDTDLGNMLCKKRGKGMDGRNGQVTLTRSPKAEMQ